MKITARKRIISFAAVILALSMTLPFTSCAVSTSAVDLTEGYESKPYPPSDVGASDEAVDFALRLLSETVGNGGNIVMSPYSVLSALALLANGADGDTLSEMESALGMTLDELNVFLPSYAASLTGNDKVKLTTANSIWIRNNDSKLHVEKSFLQKNADLYHAGAFSAPFDAGTVRDINKWISESTDGMIKKMIDSISRDAMLYLINAVLFDAEWASPYKENEVREGDFTNADGERERVDFMYGGCSGFRLENGVALERFYAGGDYAFIGVLPNEGATPEEYLRTLDGETLLTALTGDRMMARTSIPKFDISTKTELPSVLGALGMVRAFDPLLADFTGMGTYDDGSLFVSNVLHDAAITVDARGTKAGAATVIQVDGATAADVEEPEILDVYLDRPFIFFIVDTATYTPIFCGIVNNVNAGSEG